MAKLYVTYERLAFTHDGSCKDAENGAPEGIAEESKVSTYTTLLDVEADFVKKYITDDDFISPLGLTLLERSEKLCCHKSEAYDTAQSAQCYTRDVRGYKSTSDYITIQDVDNSSLGEWKTSKKLKTRLTPKLKPNDFERADESRRRANYSRKTKKEHAPRKDVNPFSILSGITT